MFRKFLERQVVILCEVAVIVSDKACGIEINKNKIVLESVCNWGSIFSRM